MTKLILAAASMACALAAHANTVTFTFLEHGLGTLGNSATFTEGGINLTATASPGQLLYAKNGGGDETGLGIAGEVDHEIDGSHFLQLTLPTTPGSNLKMIFLGSVQQGELAKIYFSHTLGVLGSPIGQVSSDGSFDISSLGAGYLGISGGGTGGADVLLDCVTAPAPDAASTFALLGMGLTGLGLVRRKLA
jgi:hypothetical protein